MEKDIQQSYLMWIGTEHYKTIDEWVLEAQEMGVSKRLPSIAMGHTLSKPGTVVFVAHDEGRTYDCSFCAGAMECVVCRRDRFEAAELEAAAKKFKDRFKGDWDTEAPRSLKRSFRVRMSAAIRFKNKIAAHSKEHTACAADQSICKGATGGYVVLNNGERWDYRRYNYWLHQPNRFDPSCVVEKHMCVHCGGTGQRPLGKIFGLFIPERIEYMAEGIELDHELDRVKGFKIVTPRERSCERPRKCGVRKPGGVYAIACSAGSSAFAKKLLKLLPSLGLGGATAHGNFIKLDMCVDISEKRFRGIKTFDIMSSVCGDSHSLASAEAAVMVADATR